ncbi:MAG: GntR domain protein [Microbacteriaceae bacterium]|nr:GntR domain protein [Microbacteriaceae bacterium]
MERFGISRPSLREAYRVLESEGLITIRRGAQGGARVQAPNSDFAAGYAGLVLQYQGATLRDLADARQIMEPPAAGILARRRDPADIAALRAIVDEEAEHGRDIHWYEPFHIKVVELTGNLTLALFARMTGHLLQLAKARYISHADEAGLPDGTTMVVLAERSHRKLLDFIEAGDAEGAEEFWARHLEAASERLLSSWPDAKVIELLG